MGSKDLKVVCDWVLGQGCSLGLVCGRGHFGSHGAYEGGVLGEEVWDPARVSEGWVGAVMTRGGGQRSKGCEGGFSCRGGRASGVGRWEGRC